MSKPQKSTLDSARNLPKCMYRIYTLEMFPMYMLETSELIVITIIFLGLLFYFCYACYVYLPQHVHTIAKKAYYYYYGNDLIDF